MMGSSFQPGRKTEYTKVKMCALQKVKPRIPEGRESEFVRIGSGQSYEDKHKH